MTPTTFPFNFGHTAQGFTQVTLGWRRKASMGNREGLVKEAKGERADIGWVERCKEEEEIDRMWVSF